MDEKEREALITNAKKNVERGRAIATGIGLFAAVYDSEGRILLRKRKEKESLYGKDLSQKWELPGGGVELDDFPPKLTDDLEYNYKEMIIDALERELEEETGLGAVKIAFIDLFVTNPAMFPAWLGKGGLIDLAFVVPIEKDLRLWEGPKYRELIQGNEIAFFSKDQLLSIEIVSPRMRFLIEMAFKAIKQ